MRMVNSTAYRAALQALLVATVAERDALAKGSYDERRASSIAGAKAYALKEELNRLQGDK